MNKPHAYYDFCIDSLTPETLRLGRFADYVKELNGIFGSDDVHFSKVRKGSAVLEFWVPEKAAPKLDARLRLVGGTDAPPEFTAHCRNLDSLLRRDNASAKLGRKNGPALARFAGVRTPLAQEAVVHETSTFDGTVVGVKGIDDSVQVWIKPDDGVLLKCNAKRDIARQLAPLWDCYVRLVGKGKWRRGGDRRWTLDEFDILNFERLDDAPLAQVVSSIQQIAGNDWNRINDAQSVWRELRAD
ncbi:hypothetical protein [Nevskia ramosa]|uniref:hypothetical protein n=1 Tax=Nevskia ramosa TaxID=64002 RepID=UPI003D1233E5